MTTPTKHTPGPWIVCVVDGEDRGYFSIEQDREALGGDEPSTIGEVYTSGEGIDMADGEANAALIAAAPDLLAACEAALSFGEGHPDRTPGWHDARLTTQLTLRAAIAKAKGGVA